MRLPSLPLSLLLLSSSAPVVLATSLPVTDPSDSTAADGSKRWPKSESNGLYASTFGIFVAMTGEALNLNTFASAVPIMDEHRWIASSTSWLDRTTCRWLGVCGLLHVHRTQSKPAEGRLAVLADSSSIPPKDTLEADDDEIQDAIDRANEAERHWDDNNSLAPTSIPDYVMEYAPLVYLHPTEVYWPTSFVDHLDHVIPSVNFTYAPPALQHLGVNNLSIINMWGWSTFLNSKDNPEDDPAWLKGATVPMNLVDEGDCIDELTGRACGRQTQTVMGGVNRSQKPNKVDSPVPVIVIERPDGTVDAFWWFFYSFNLGNSLLGIRFGNHIGDWEHMVIRYRDGIPQEVFYSQHTNGRSYAYDAVDKIGKRPVAFSGRGTHAMYPTPGLQTYALPFSLLFDQTGYGPLWDPALNVVAVARHFSTGQSRIVKTNTSAPVESLSWLEYVGQWGDETFRLSDPRQYRIAANYYYGRGPTGPNMHNLNRTSICQEDKSCSRYTSIWH